MHKLCSYRIFLLILISSLLFPAMASATPDFIVASVAVPDFANEGETITVQVTVQNQRYIIDQTGNYIRVEILLSSDSNISLTDQPLAYFDVPKDGLQTGLTYGPENVSVTLPTGVSGSYYIGVYVDYTTNSDADGYWTELDETNNTGYDSTPINISSTDPPPPAPSLNTPANGITTDDQTPDLSWSQSGSASYFQVQIATDSNFSNITIDESHVNSLNFTPPLLNDDTYWWRVRTYFGSWSSWSSSRWFSLNAHLSAPNLTAPIGGQNLSGPPYHFNWNPVVGAHAYYLKISTSHDFSTAVFFDENIPASAISYNYNGALQWGTTHYWQMRTLNSDGTVWGEWSSVESFVPRSESQIELNVPGNGATITDADINFDWSDVPGIDHYEILVDNNSGFGSPEIHEPGIQIKSPQTLTESQYRVTNYLPDNTYYWKIITHLSDGSTQESETRSFTYHLPVAAKPVFVPLFRLYNPTNHDHFYTTIPVQRDSANGYTFEKVEGCISDRKFNHEHCGYLFRLYNPSADVHYYTSNGTDRNQHIIDGYDYEGIVGFLYTLTGEGVMPLRHLENTGNTDHFYTINTMEAQNAVDNLGFISQGIVGYISPDGIKEPLVHSQPQANFGGVDLGSGAYRGLNNLDLIMKGRGLDLGFAHFYNSFNFKKIPMGPGWSHNFCVYATEGFDGTVFIFWGNGTTSIFSLDHGTYVDQTGNHDRLEPDDVNYGYNLTRKNQTVYQFRRFSAYPYALHGEEVIVLLKVKDVYGNELTFDYQNTTTISDSMGRSFELFYDGNTRQLTDVVEKAAGMTKRSVHFAYDADGLLDTFTDAKGKITRYVYYDEPTTRRHQLLKSITYPEQNTVVIDYDQATGKVSHVNDNASSNPAVISYEPENNRTIVFDPVTNARFLYDHPGGILSRFKEDSDPNWRSVIEHTDDNNPNLPTRVVDMDGHATIYEYDPRGNLTKITNARNWEATYSYFENNRIKTATFFPDPNDLDPPTTTYTYYSANPNLLKKISRPETGVVELFYDAHNQVAQVKDGRNFLTHFTYDTYGNLKQVTDDEDNITQYVNDYAGRTISVTDAEGIKTTYAYDNNDNPGTITNYARDGQSIIRTINRAYDDNDNLDDVRWNNSGTNSLTDYSYDSRDRLQQVTTATGFSKVFTYYDNDLPKTITDCNNITATLVYDDHNRLKEKNYNDNSQNVDYEYFLNGKLKQVYQGNDTSLKTAFTYNDLNLVESVTDRYGKTVSYTYDNGGRLTAIHYPGGFDVTYTYDTADRLEEVFAEGSRLVTYEYDNAGNLVKIDRANDVDTWYYYDDASRLTSLTEKTSSGSTLWSYTFVLDHVGNHTSVTAANEPYEFIPETEDINYTNDKASNRLLLAGATSFTYDNNGNRKTSQTGGVTTTYGWDNENHLTSISNLNLSFTYDAFGNRIARSENGQTIRYVLDLNGGMSRVLAETDAAGNETAYYVYGLGLLAVIDADNTSVRHFYHFNHRGDTVALTDNSGQKTKCYAYDEYGRVQEDNNTFDQPFKFVGQYGVMDEGHDLYFMRARFYDAHAGRFLSVDPLGFEGGDWNLFAYVGGRPLVKVDPEGKTWFHPKWEPYVVGSEKFFAGKFKPGKQPLKWIEDYIPNFHDFGILHDDIVDSCIVENEPSWLAMSKNLFTMPGAYFITLYENLDKNQIKLKDLFLPLPVK